jgi:hypothetical protein
MAKTFLDLQNLRASKFAESTASKILDVDLARFFNEITSDMVQHGRVLKHVTTNIVSAQSDYTNSVLPGFIATALVKINGVVAPFIGIDDYAYETDRNTTCHTVANNSLVLLPTPTASVTNGLDVWYWAKLPEIIDAAVAGTALTGVDEKYWACICAGILAKGYEKLLIYYTTKKEEIPDADLPSLRAIHESFEKKYQNELEKYESLSTFFTFPSYRGPNAQENNMQPGIGRQDK